MIKFRLLLPLHSKRQLLSESPPLLLFRTSGSRFCPTFASRCLFTVFAYGLFRLLFISGRFTFLKTFVNRFAKHAQNQVDRFRRIVVSRNNEVYIRRVGVRIDHGKHRNTEAIGFTHSNVLLHYVYHEQGCRQTIQVGNRTEHLFQLGTLTGNL